MDENWVSDLTRISPLIALSIGSFVVLIMDVFSRARWSRGLLTAVFLVFSLALSTWVSCGGSAGETIFSGLIYADQFTCFFTFMIIFGALLSVLLGLKRLTDEGIESRGEYYSLLLMSTCGAIIFVSAAELITLFVGLEIMSMALYCLCGSAIGFKRSAESALKYFFLGSFSSAFLLYGIALVYGLSGSTSIAELSHYVAAADRSPLLFLGMGLMLVGLIFKVGAVPFHFWAPDVYEGAPTPITAYMACVIKTAAVGVALRVMWVGFGKMIIFWSGALWMVALMTMVLGNFVALHQRSLKRMLAYSSIAHAGYILVAFLSMPGAATDKFSGGPAVLYYIVAYTIMTMGAFGVVLAVSSTNAAQGGSDDISQFNGLGYTKPFLGVVMSLFLLSLAGVPPGMAGFLGKFYVFSAAVKSDFIGLTIIGVLCSAVSCYYYLRVIVAMYFIDPDEDGRRYDLGTGMKAVLIVCAAGVILLGVFPSLVYDRAVQIMTGF